MKRDKTQVMSFETFKKCVQLFKQDPSRTNILNLHNFGEPLLHPELVSFIDYAINEEQIKVRFSTNFVLMTEFMLTKLKVAGLKHLIVSVHTCVESKIKEKLDLYKKRGLLDFLDTLEIWGREINHNFAGQVDSINSFKKVTNHCIYRDEDAYVILPNGNINTCCISVEDQNLGLTVDDLLNGVVYKFKPIDLCKSCDLDIFDWK
jgi:uncharacterized Fe-S cluster-containing radical SAM superfamily enzyme